MANRYVYLSTWIALLTSHEGAYVDIPYVVVKKRNVMMMQYIFVRQQISSCFRGKKYNTMKAFCQYLATELMTMMMMVDGDDDEDEDDDDAIMMVKLKGSITYI